MNRSNFVAKIHLCGIIDLCKMSTNNDWMFRVNIWPSLWEK